MRKVLFFMVIVLALSIFVLGAPAPYNELTNSYSALRVFHLNSSSGTTAIDSLGISNGMALNVEDIDWISSIPEFGNALSLDDVDEAINTSYIYYMQDPITLSWRMNITNDTGVQGDAVFAARTSSSSENFNMIIRTDQDPDAFRIQCNSGGGETVIQWPAYPYFHDRKFHHVVFRHYGGNCDESSPIELWIDGVNITPTLFVSGTNTGNGSAGNIYFGRAGDGGGSYSAPDVDEILIFRRAITTAQILELNSSSGVLPAPTVSSVNCTSCNIPFGDSISPYTTADTTPTFTFLTDVNANCRIGGSNLNYTGMGPSRACTSGGGGTGPHTCTLTTQDELTQSDTTVYLGCQNTDGIESAGASPGGTLRMDIVNLSQTFSDAIQAGVQASAIWPGATSYSDQQVYLRNLQNTQVLATVDRVVISGNQRWIFNAISGTEAAAGLFNITPVVYVFEFQNYSSVAITSKVSGIINATKT